MLVEDMRSEKCSVEGVFGGYPVVGRIHKAQLADVLRQAKTIMEENPDNVVMYGAVPLSIEIDRPYENDPNAEGYPTEDEDRSQVSITQAMSFLFTGDNVKIDLGIMQVLEFPGNAAMSCEVEVLRESVVLRNEYFDTNENTPEAAFLYEIVEHLIGNFDFTELVKQWEDITIQYDREEIDPKILKKRQFKTCEKWADKKDMNAFNRFILDATGRIVHSHKA